MTLPRETDSNIENGIGHGARMTELELPRQFLNPLTGEALTLASPDEDLARWLADIREVESVIRENKKIVQREILSRMDRSASWTVRVPGFKLTGQSPAPVEEWDGVELRTALLGLVDEGLLTIEAVDGAVETVVAYKPRKAGIVKLRKLGGRVAETVDLLARASEPERRVSVGRA